MFHHSADLSHPLHDDISLYPGSPKPSFAPVQTMARDGYNQRRIIMQSHMGTHLDAPCHIIDGGKTLSELPLQQFFGRAVVISCAQAQSISKAWLEPHAATIERAEFVLLATGWDRFWGSDQYLKDFPVPDEAAIEWLVKFPLKGIGLDTCSPDPVGSQNYPNHHHILGKEMLIIENLRGLTELPEVQVDFLCPPLPIRDGDGAPVRAFARW